MQAPESNFKLRERNFWESADLAILMLRHWVLPLLASFGAIFGLCCTLCILGLALGLDWLVNGLSWLPIVLIWYLKPVWERIIISQAGLLFFHSKASLGQRFSALGRIFSTELLKDLTWGRFSLYRAYRLPLRMFERPERARRRDRRRWLCQEMGGQLLGVIAIYYGIELLVFFAIYLSSNEIFGANLLGTHSSESDLTGYVFTTISYFITLLIIEPLYVLNCFSLYINRRTLHEGWDLRLALHKLLANRAQGRKPLGAKIVALVFGLLLAGLNAPGLSAQTAQKPAEPAASVDYQGQLQQTMDTRDFGGIDQSVEWGFKEQTNNAKTPEVKMPPLPDLIGPNILRIAVFIAAGALVVILVILIFKRLPGLRRAKAPAAPPPVVTAVVPTDHQKRALALAEGWEAWQRGDQRQAMACLYQTGISLATKIHLVKLPSSATEGRCLSIISHSSAPYGFTQLFGELTRAWTQVSWSHRPLDEARFNQLYSALTEEQGKLSA